MSVRFYPLSDDPFTGVLARDGRGGPKPVVAEYLSPEEAKRRALFKIKKTKAA